MIESHPIEQSIGIKYYISDTPGIGGKLRASAEDFRVSEIEGAEFHPVSASAAKYPFVVVRVTLHDWETHQFARTLSNRLGISRERISWAGTKDKRAVTTQLMSIDKVEPESIPSISGTTITPVGRMGRKIVLGDLAGNRFEITVREPDRPQNLTPITETLQEFGGGTVGIPNYFGQQRFGSIRPVTHDVGFRILEGDWKGAVLAYVGNPHENETDETRQARQFVTDTEDWSAALDVFPEYLQYERSILHFLSGTATPNEEEFRLALMELPWNIQQLFVHAAQSYLFNLILSRRLGEGLPFGEAEVGDVVCFAEEVNGVRVPDPERTQRVTSENISTVNRHVDRGRAYVTAPLIGTDTALGEEEIGDIERQVLGSMDLTRSDFELPGAFDSSGTRRAILVHTELTTEIDPVQFCFSLPKGAYATVLLRELMKVTPLEL